MKLADLKILSAAIVLSLLKLATSEIFVSERKNFDLQAEEWHEYELSGRKLPDEDFWPAGESDPYIIVKINGTKVYQSESLDSTLNPNFSRKLIVQYNPYDTLKFDIWDYDGGVVSDDDFMCGTTISGDRLNGSFSLSPSGTLIVNLTRKCYDRNCAVELTTTLPTTTTTLPTTTTTLPTTKTTLPTTTTTLPTTTTTLPTTTTTLPTTTTTHDSTIAPSTSTTPSGTTVNPETSTTESPSDSTDPVKFCMSKPCGTYLDPDDSTNCTSFIRCKGGDGEPSIQKCPQSLKYNLLIQTCDLAERFECHFSCEGKPDGNYQNSKDCHTFFSCWSGNKLLIYCPDNEYYNPVWDMCDWSDWSSQFCYNGEL